MSDADARENLLSVYTEETRDLVELLAHDVPRWAASDERWERIDHTLAQLQRAIAAGDATAASAVADHLVLLGPQRNARRLTAEDRAVSDSTRELIAVLVASLPSGPPSQIRTKGFGHVTMTEE